MSTTINGTTSRPPTPSSQPANDLPTNDADDLRTNLARVRAEKEELESQYNSLLNKLSTMRTSVANKLKQDAEELDRREQLVQQLTVEAEELSLNVETLKSELVLSNTDAERLTIELSTLRAQSREHDATEAHSRERALHEAYAEAERARLTAEEWARAAEQERLMREEAREAASAARRDLELERDAREALERELGVDREKAANLQSVLEDFQAARDHELAQAVKGYDSRLTQVTQSLAEFKHRAHIAELKLEESSINNSRTTELEKEVKEKTVLIGKLRHEAVILNEHLNEALRRLRKNATDQNSNVDRRLVTNILLSFLNAPRGDSKRFEMLKVLSDILSWNEDERQKAGLQRGHGAVSMSRSPSKASTDLERTDETESFSQMWVEFLLTQAEGANDDAVPPSPTRSAPSPHSPLRKLSSSSLASPPVTADQVRRSSSWIRLPSFGSSASVREASPPPPVPPVPSERALGKQRAM